MEQKYRDAVFAGLKCGVVIAGLYVIYTTVSLVLSSTPAMVSYINYYHTHPHIASYPGYIPIESQIIEILPIVQLATLVIGFLITGVYALRSGERRKNTVNHIVTIGAIAGISAFIPHFVAVVILDIFLAAIGNPYSLLTPGSPAIPGMTISGIGLSFGCCLSEGIIISAILSAVGAWGYAYFTKGIRHLS